MFHFFHLSLFSDHVPETFRICFDLVTIFSSYILFACQTCAVGVCLMGRSPTETLLWPAVEHVSFFGNVPSKNKNGMKKYSTKYISPLKKVDI